MAQRQCKSMVSAVQTLALSLPMRYMIMRDQYLYVHTHTHTSQKSGEELGHQCVTPRPETRTLYSCSVDSGVTGDHRPQLSMCAAAADSCSGSIGTVRVIARLGGPQDNQIEGPAAGLRKNQVAD